MKTIYDEINKTYSLVTNNDFTVDGFLFCPEPKYNSFGYYLMIKDEVTFYYKNCKKSISRTDMIYHFNACESIKHDINTLLWASESYVPFERDMLPLLYLTTRQKDYFTGSIVTLDKMIAFYESRLNPLNLALKAS